MESINLPFSITDFTGNPTLSSYSCPLTPINVSINIPYSSNLSNTLAIWDFGDGTRVTGLTASNVYTWPGNYNITLTLFDFNGNSVINTFSPQIQIFNLIPDQISSNSLDTFKIYNLKAGQISPPITINRINSWQSITPTLSNYTINLYVSGSKSDYLDINFYNSNAWSHLNSYFYFLSSDGETPINSIATSCDPIYAYTSNNSIGFSSYPILNSILVGTSGTCTYYFTDDRVKNYTYEEPLIIFSSLDTTNFPDKISNKLNYTGNAPMGNLNFNTIQQFVKTRFNNATQLSITSNGIDGEGSKSNSFNICPIKFQDSPISFVIKLKDDNWYSTKSYPLLSAFNNVNFGLNIDLVQVNSNGSLTQIPNVNFYNGTYIPQLSANPSDGGYYSGYLTFNNSVLNVALTASTVITNPNYYANDYTYGFIFQPNVYSIYRFQRDRMYSNATGPLVTNFNTQETTLNSPMSSSLGIAVNSSEQTIWYADSTNENIYKADFNGNILYTVCLTGANFYGSDGNIYNRDFRLNGFATPRSISLDSNGDAWVSLYNALSAIKIESSTGIIDSLACPLQYTNTITTTGSFSYTSQLSSFLGKNSILPHSVDTDSFNNVWITYSNPLSSFLIKYDTLGNLLSSYRFPVGYSCKNVILDNKNF